MLRLLPAVIVTRYINNNVRCCQQVSCRLLGTFRLRWLSEAYLHSLQLWNVGRVAHLYIPFRRTLLSFDQHKLFQDRSSRTRNENKQIGNQEYELCKPLTSDQAMKSLGLIRHITNKSQMSADNCYSKFTTRKNSHLATVVCDNNLHSSLWSITL